MSLVHACSAPGCSALTMSDRCLEHERVGQARLLTRAGTVVDRLLADDPDVSRAVVVRGDQTLEDLHDVLRKAFRWHGDFPYSFRIDGIELASPLFAEPGARTADVPLDELGLEPGYEFAHAVDANEGWRIALQLRSVRPAGDERLPRVLERHGEAALEPEYELGGGG